jgi:hypothetical protein
MSGRKRQAVAPLRAADLAKTRQQSPPVVERSAPEVERRPADAVTPVVAATTELPERKIKYSQNMDESVHENLELIVRLSRRSLRRHVTKAQVLDALINRCADDASLRDQIIDDLGSR